VCDIDFGMDYGGIADGYIHVHHIVPIASVGKQYKLNPLTDLVPVCPNCHAMLHHGMKEPQTVAELRRILARTP
jgi:5-methylcytosine-specific restriction protein A